jgi:tellurite resistance protein TehA-like permease
MLDIAFLAVVPAILIKKNGNWRLGMSFKMQWWAMIFPNVGLTLATAYIGEGLESEGVKWVASVIPVLLVAAWLMDLGLTVNAEWTRKILWPGKDEDKGSWKT